LPILNLYEKIHHIYNKKEIPPAPLKGGVAAILYITLFCNLQNYLCIESSLLRGLGGFLNIKTIILLPILNIYNKKYINI